MTLPIPTRGLRHLALRVRDVERSKRFYADVFGMQVVWEPDPDNSYLSSGCDNLALHRTDTLHVGTDQPLDHLGFIVASAAAVHSAAAALRGHGVTILQEPKLHRDGSTSLYCADPDGNRIQILFEPEIGPLRFS